MEHDKIDFVKRVVDVADDMAAAMCSLNSHTYKNFIDLREELKIILEEFVDRVDMLK